MINVYIALFTCLYVAAGGFIAGKEYQEQTDGNPGPFIRTWLAIMVWFFFGPIIYIMDWTLAFLAWAFKQIDRYDIVRFVFVFHFYPKKYMWSQSKLGEFNYMVHTKHSGNTINDRLFRWAMKKINKRNGYVFDLPDFEENGRKY